MCLFHYLVLWPLSLSLFPLFFLSFLIRPLKVSVVKVKVPNAIYMRGEGTGVGQSRM